MGVIADAVGDAVGFVADTVGDVVQGALDDPIGTIAKVAVVSTGQAYLLPVISAGTTLANGGDLGDALKSGAITYAAGQVGGWAADEVGTAANYGTDLGSQQTAMLAAQDAGMGVGNALGGAAGAAAGSATGALLSGGDVGQAIMGGLAGYGARLGMNLGTDALGRIVNSAGDIIADSYDELSSMMGDEYGDQPGDFPTTPEDLAAADAELAGMEGAPIGGWGDQEGDFPLNENELAATDNTMDQTADQPGDYDTTPEEQAASEAQLAELPGAQTDLNLSGVADYFKNQLINSGIKNLLGGALGSGYVSRGNNSAGAGMGLGSSSSGWIGDLSSSFSSPIDNQGQNNSRIDLYGSGQSNTVAPQTVLKNLGFSGDYINPNAQTYYQTPLDAQNAKKAQQIISAGWQGEGQDQFGQTTANDPYGMYSDTSNTYQTGYAKGGLTSLSQDDHIPSFYSEGGMENSYVRGEGDGTSDGVKAMLARGEFVIPADVVANLGNGDNEAGAEVLDQFMRVIRKHKRSTDESQLPPDSKGPLDYLKVAYKKAGR